MAISFTFSPLSEGSRSEHCRGNIRLYFVPIFWHRAKVGIKSEYMNDSSPTGPEPWPEWLEDFRLPDELFAQAYAAYPAKCRAAIKTSLALATFHFGQSARDGWHDLRDRHLGFWQKCCSSPQNWAIIFLDDKFNAPAPLCAATVLPVLADVENIAIVCIGGIPRQSILLTLELCGIEDIFCLSLLDAKKLLTHIPAGGNAIIFNCTDQRGEIEQLTFARGIPFYTPPWPPRAVLCDEDDFDKETLEFCLGFAPSRIDDKFAAEQADVVYAAPGRISELQKSGGSYGRLLITPGCEGFWLFRDLFPAFFRNNTYGFGFI